MSSALKPGRKQALITCTESEISAESSIDVISIDVNMMFKYIVWYPGYIPMMILNGKVLQLDVIADSILDEPFINYPISIGAVHIACAEDSDDYTCEHSSESPRSELLCFKVTGRAPRLVSCWNFIDWFNSAVDSDINFVIDHIEVQIVSNIAEITMRIKKNNGV